METVLKFAVKLATALSALICIGLGCFSLFTDQNAMVTLVMFLIGGILSLFTYIDVRDFLNKGKL